jgi:RimJ/RimL family protein N-acetyltransferase
MINKSNSEIIIRKGKLADVEGIIAMMKVGFKRKNWIYTSSNEVTKDKLKRLKEGFKSKNPDSYTFIAIDKKTKVLVGSMSAHFRKNGRFRHRIEMGWGIHPDYQGRGIATKLMNDTLKLAKEKGFKRAEAEIVIKNICSWKLAKKCGFKIEGTKKKALLTDDGKYIDTYIVGKIL